MSTKRTQIENRIAQLNPGWTLEQGYHHGTLVWYVKPDRVSAMVGQLTSGPSYVDYWANLSDAHRDIFDNQGIRADNYND